MHHTLTVRLVQRIGDLDGVFEGLIQRQSAFLQTLLERLTLHVLHDEVVNPVLFADVVERADVRVVQAADGPCFTLEAFPALRIGGQVFGKDFDGNRAVQPGVGCTIHLTHTTGTELVGDFVWAQARTCSERHWLPPGDVRS